LNFSNTSFWCFLAFAQSGSFEDDLLNTDNWISYWYNQTYQEGMINPVGDNNDKNRYVLSLFWSLQTITSIGYGNIVPFTTLEWWFGCFFMLISGVLWAYIIGSLVNVAAELQIQRGLHRTRNDEVNEMIGHFNKRDPALDDSCERGIYDTEMFPKRLKKYIHAQKMSGKLTSMIKIGRFYPVMESLSPEMQRVSSFMLVREYLEHVPYLSSRFLSMEERSLVAKECIGFEFPAGEVIHISEGRGSIGRGICIFVRGTAFALHGKVSNFSDRRKRYSVVTAGHTFGVSDVLLEDEHARSEGKIEVITFSRVLFIPRKSVLAALERNQNAWKQCARWKYLLAAMYSSRIESQLAETQPKND